MAAAAAPTELLPLEPGPSRLTTRPRLAVCGPLSAGAARPRRSRSAAVSSRTSPTCMPSRRSVPMRTRTRRATGTPTAANIRRSWRRQPCASVTRYQVSPCGPSSVAPRSLAVSGAVASRSPTTRARPSSSGIPPRSASSSAWLNGRARPTAYSRSTPKLGWLSRWPQSPSFVSRMSPSESRSRRPTGKRRPARRRRSGGTSWRTVRSACRSLTVDVTPMGLSRAR